MLELVTRKIYYKKFNHRLAIEVRKSNAAKEKSRPTPEIIEWLLDHSDVGEWRGISTTSYEGNCWHKRACTYTVFSKDLRAYELLKEQLGAQALKELEKPLDDAHTRMMEREKVVTRKRLFHDRYRIAIRVKAQRKPGTAYGYFTDHVDRMAQWVVDQHGAYVKDGPYRIHRWNDATFYFKDPKDAMLFKLVHGDDIHATERVVLVSELEEQRVQAGQPDSTS